MLLQQLFSFHTFALLPGGWVYPSSGDLKHYLKSLLFQEGGREQKEMDTGLSPASTKDAASLKAAATKTTLFRAGLGVGVARGPVFGWEGDVPEMGIGEQELNADFDLLVGKFVNVSDDAFE